MFSVVSVPPESVVASNGAARGELLAPRIAAKAAVNHSIHEYTLQINIHLYQQTHSPTSPQPCHMCCHFWIIQLQSPLPASVPQLAACYTGV